ncbi:hypothetical protein GBAR_LOCUS10307 [Geodia barretti]|nr:hypothetical protein GBAR_LOCUS10307 [Geodia barretti]
MLYSDAPELQPKRYPPPEFRSPQSENSSSSRIEGFGNSSFGGSRTAPSSSTTDKLKALFGSSGNKPTSSPLVYDESYATMDPVPHNMHAPAAGGGRYGGGLVSGAGYAPRRYLDHGMPEGEPHRSGEAGGGWGYSPDQPSSSVPQPPPVFEETAAQPEQHYPSLAIAESEDRNTEQERRLVDDITAPGGVKAAPPRDTLSTFISRCKALDSLAVVEFLRQKLQDQDQTQVVLRTLFVVEAMLKSDIPEVFSQMDLILQELHSLTTSTNTTIRAKAKKIMQQLAVEEETRNMASTERNISSSSQSGSGGVSVTVVSGAILDLGEGGEEGGGGERESTDQSLPPDMAGLFAGMSVSNQSPNVPPNVPLTGPPTAMVPSRQRHTSPQQKRPQHSTAADQTESASPFGDLLGLSSSSPSQLTSTITEQDPRQTEEEREGEPSLMVLEDERDVNFDPLAAGTDLVGSKSNAVTGSVSLGKPRTAPPPSSGSNEVMSELSGLDLTVRSQTDTRFQNGIGTSILQSHALDSSSFVSSSSVSTTTLGSTPLVPGVAPSQIVGGVYGRVQMPGQVPYMGPGSVPYGMQPGQAMPPQAGGMQLYTNPQGAPIMYLNQPRLGGDARPVQRPLVMAATDSHDSQSSFDFLGKSSKGAAFDFVKEEIDIAKKK